MKVKPLAGVSLDLDNLWSYMKTHGDDGWKAYPSYYEIFVPYILDILKELDIKITFFIVGLDAMDERNKPYLTMISEAGHDIANHSFKHEVWINQYSNEQVAAEIENAEKAIYDATGKVTRGFRGPGFSWNESILEVLHDRDYLYDASTLPTFIGPFARMYYFRRSDFSKVERQKRSNLFGPFSEGFRKLKPYLFKIKPGKRILEIPITTIPVLKIPFHMSYLIYISSISSWLMKGYLNFALFMCGITRTPISFLLHPLDIIGGDKIKELEFFPGMNIESERKILILKDVMKILMKNFKLVDMNSFALSLLESHANK
jgi:peptidoglycan-N-acetylglucosamine deacetylase